MPASSRGNAPFAAGLTAKKGRGRRTVQSFNIISDMPDLASPLTVFTMAINFTLGAGVLGLPYAVASAGVVASMASLVFVALLSSLTSSWLLEVGDRANALQNELARSQKHRTVQHANGDVSVLPPASDFCFSSALSEPLLEKGERKLDEYRAAYRSWRTGSHKGVLYDAHKEYMSMNLFDSSKHRKLLPLQLMPPPRVSDQDESLDSSLLTSPELETPLGHRSAFTSAGASSQSLEAQGRAPTLRRNASFSVELAEALAALPASHFDAAEAEVRSVYVAPTPSLAEPADPAALAAAATSPVRRCGRAALRQKSAPAYAAADAEPAEPEPMPDADADADTDVDDRRTRSVWIFAICSLHLAAMWACCAIWTTCAHALLGLDARALLVLCAAVFLPLSTLGGTAIVQPPLAVATLATLALMILLLGHALYARASGAPPVFDLPPPALGGGGGGGPTGGAGGAVDPAEAAAARFRALVVDVGAFGPAFATFLFSFILQQSVPSLVRTAAQPERMRAAIGAAIATCCGLYLLLGGFAALLFGHRTDPLITLNFGAFRGGAPAGAPPPLWATLVSRWVMLLPLLTTTAAFPLFNGVLASNLVGLLPLSWGRLRSHKVAAALCALPPLLCTAVVRDTPFLFSLCGLSGFAIVFFVPAALQHAAMRATVERWGMAGRATPHTTVFSSTAPVLAVSVFAGAAFTFNCWLVLLKPVVGALLARQSRES